MRAVVLLGHGSRAAGASEAMVLVAEAVRARVGGRVEVAHMELAEPSLDQVVEGMHADGIRRISLVPYFLHHGVHLREDIPGIVQGLLARLEGLEISMAPHLGFDDALVDVVERRLSQVVPFGEVAP